MTSPPLFSVEGLRIEVDRDGRRATAVDGFEVTVAPGECVGLVGESGCGKSLTLKALLGLLPAGAQIVGGRFTYRPDLVDQPMSMAGRLRGRHAAMIFQEPMSALNPLMTVGDQIAEALRVRSSGRRRRPPRDRVVELMAEVGIPDPARRANAWPHEMSGGMAQRVVIAMALALEPSLLLADEPTTALDVTIQDQILTLLDRLRRDRNLATVFVSHDLSVIRRVADRVLVMYAGRVVEQGTVQQILQSPRHPYTQGLLAATPSIDNVATRLLPIQGTPPSPEHYPAGCRFNPRCAFAQAACCEAVPEFVDLSAAHRVACIRVHEIEHAR